MNNSKPKLLIVICAFVLAACVIVFATNKYSREEIKVPAYVENAFYSVLVIEEGYGGKLERAILFQGFSDENKRCFLSVFPGSYPWGGSLLSRYYEEGGRDRLVAFMQEQLTNPIDASLVISEKARKLLISYATPSLELDGAYVLRKGALRYGFKAGVYTPTEEESLAIFAIPDSYGELAQLRFVQTRAIVAALAIQAKAKELETTDILVGDFKLKTSERISPQGITKIIMQRSARDFYLLPPLSSGEIFAQKLGQFLAIEGLVPWTSPLDLSFNTPVKVLNGCGWSGLAGRTTSYLERSGFNVLEAASADSFLYKTSEIHYPATPEGRETALVLGALIHCRELISEPAASRKEVVLILGQDFGDQYYVNQPPRQSANTTTTPSSTDSNKNTNKE